MESLNDPLVCSVFKQARFITYASDSHRVSVELSKDFVLFKEWLDGSKLFWEPLLREFFSPQTVLDTQFTGVQKVEVGSKKQKSDEAVVSTNSSPVIQQYKEKQFSPKPQEQFRGGSRYSAKKTVVIPANKHELRIDVSDENRWKTASILLRHFPGVITEMRENQ